MPKRYDNRSTYKEYNRAKTPTKVLAISEMESLSTYHPSVINDRHFANTQNMIRRRDGLFENRKGYKQFGEAVGSDLGVHSLRFWRTATGDRYLTIGTGSKLYSYAEGAEYNNGTYTFRGDIIDDIANIGINGQLVPEEERLAPREDGRYLFDSGVYSDQLLLVNGHTKTITSADNINFTYTDDPKNVVSRFIEIANDIVSYSGIPGDESDLQLSAGAPEFPDLVDPNSILTLDQNNGQFITGHRSLGPSIIVYKDQSAYAVAVADLSTQKLDYNGGTLSNRSILQTELNEVLAAGRQGIFSIKKTQIGDNRLFGASESQLIDDLYKTTIDYSNINAVYDPTTNLAMWTAKTNAGIKSFVKHMSFDKSWTFFTGINASHWTVYYDQEDQPHLLFGDASTDRVFEMFKGRSDNGAPIDAVLTTKRYDFGQPGIQKQVQYVDLLGYMSANAEWTIEMFKDDNETTPFKTVTVTMNGDDDIILNAELGAAALGEKPLGGFLGDSDDLEVYPIRKRIVVNESLENMQIRLTNNQKDVRVVFKSMLAYFSYGAQDDFPYEDIL